MVVLTRFGFCHLENVSFLLFRNGTQRDLLQQKDLREL